MKEIRAENVKASEGHYIVGKVQKAHGIRGEIFIYLFAKEAEWLSQLKEISLISVLPKGEFSYKTYSLKKKSFHKEGLILSSNEIKDRNQAEELKGTFFQIPESFLQTSEADSQFYLKEILDFELRLKDGENVGVVKAFSSNGAQDLIIVQTAKGEFDIPLVNDFIIEVNRREKYLQMDLPLGLLGEEVE